MENALASALAVWNSTPCGAPALQYIGSTDSPATAGDGVITIEFVSGAWEARGFESAAAAITDVGYLRADAASDWTIEDADIYINSQSYQWTPFGARTTGTLRSLPMALIHELGHALGLLHPCELDGREGAPTCSEVPEFRDRTMYPEYVEGAMATPGDDDLAGLCFLYPGACVPGSCPESQECTASGCRDVCGVAPCGDGQRCVREICIACPDGVCGDACAIDAHCASGETCDRGLCVPQGRPLGDPCDDDHACAPGTCGSESFCVPACEPGSAVECTSMLGAQGDPCEYSTDCLGERCLEGASPTPICTRRCSAELPCVAPWECDQIDGQAVCRPPRAAEPGCSISARARVPGSLCSLMFALAACIAVRRLRSRRLMENAR